MSESAQEDSLIRDGEIRGTSPWTGQPLVAVRMASEQDVAAAVEQARGAQRAWANLSRSERLGTLKRVAKRLLRERHHGLAIVEEELGKVPADALFTEGLGPLDALTGWARVIDSAPQGRVGLNPVAFPKKNARIELRPRGVVGVIAPWNFPVAGLYRSVFPALLLGNCVVVKPSEHSPRSSGWFLKVLAEELPPGVVGIVQGGPEVGAKLLEQSLDACVFTGSTQVGQHIERSCFERGIACSAEMGGNDAAIVLEDADLERTCAGLIHWSLQNAGQACGAVEVVYVDSRIKEKLEQALAAALGKILPATSAQPSGSVAPLAFAAQRDKVMAHITQAQQAGARTLCGGSSRGNFVEPTLLTDCHDDMDVVREETFGPVVPLVEVDGAADAVRRVNRGRYGLTASIWTANSERATRLASKLDVGVVTINNHAFTGAIVDLPWAGRRDSGRGIANSAWSLLTFARPQTVVVDNSSSFEAFWAPFDDQLVELGHLLADAQLGRVFGAVKIPVLLNQRMRKLKEFFKL